MFYPLLFKTVTRLSALLLITLAVSRPSIAAEPALSLDEALAIATRDSSLLSAQRSAIFAAQESTVSARELPDPKLRLGIENLPVDGPDRYSVTRDFMTMRKIGVAQDFPRAEKREIKGRRAESQLAREQAMLADTHAALRRDVATAWMERFYAGQMAQIIEQQYAETVLQRDALQAGVAANRTSSTERLALEVTLQTLLDRRAEFDKQSARAQATLSRWLGDAARRPLAPPTEFTSAGSIGTHVPHHPHVQSLERQIDIAQSEADLAKAATKSDWGMELSYQQRGPTYSNMVSLQVSIDLPLFTDRRQNRDAAAKLALVEQARALREDGLRQHLAEAATAQAEYEAATARLKRFDDALLPLARDHVTLSLAAYRGGIGTLASVLEARRTEIDLRLQKLQLAAEQGRARAQLMYFLPEENTK
jgi:outer membrane protein TolC